MSNELLITKSENKILSIQVVDGKIQQIHAEEDSTEKTSDEAVCVGDIYVGKVRNIVKNINAAFVEFSRGQMGYLSLSCGQLPLHTQGFPFQEGRVLIGDEIIVQVAKEAVKTKPPTLTGFLDLTGRYVVLSVGKQGCHISKKIREKAVRERLSEILQEYSAQQYALIARTNSAQIPEQLLRQELASLKQRYEKIVTQGIHRAPFCQLEKAPAGYLCDIRDGYMKQMEQIVTDDEDLYQEIADYLNACCPGEGAKLVKWNPERGKLDAVYNVSKTLEHALMPKVWLKSGAYLVIQPTEALVSIDVNTGKAISRKKDVQKTYFKVNVEAAQEIAHQLRLRNLSGMILIDFIDMESEEDNQKLLEILRQAVRSDQVQTTVVDMTKLGLVELTRKKVRKSLYEQIRQPNS